MNRLPQSVALAGFILLLFFGVFWLRGHASVLLQSLGIVYTPEAVTELYFDEYPQVTGPITGGEPLKIAFVIHNSEGREMTYAYKVYLQTPGGLEIPIEEGSETVPDKERIVVKSEYVFPPLFSSVELFVELTTVDLKLHVRLPNHQ